MAAELELKAVVPDADALRARLRAAGARLVRAGRMRDRRFDRAGELAARDEVLRLRAYEFGGGDRLARLDWKGPTRRAAGGYKLREELECRLADDVESAERILAALGYVVVHAIDRDVEYYALGGATVRLERYPQMDDLVEVEGDPAAIEAAIAATGLPRGSFTADALVDFTARFEARTGRKALVSHAGPA